MRLCWRATAGAHAVPLQNRPRPARRRPTRPQVGGGVLVEFKPPAWYCRCTGMSTCNGIHPTNSPTPSGAAAPGGGVAAPSSSVHRSETTAHAPTLETRSTRWHHRNHAPERNAILAAFRDSDDDELSRRLTRLERCCCATVLWARPSGQIDAVPTRCRDRMCPACSRQRARKAAQRTQEACRRMDSIRLLTLTAPAVADPLKAQLGGLRKALAGLRRTREWKKHVRGGFYVIEITYNAQTGLWHPHVHVLADGVFWDQKSIREAWRAALAAHSECWKLDDDSLVIVDIRFVHSGRDAARYMAKYVAKAAKLEEWPPPAIREYALATHGMRSLATFGTLHGVSLDPADPNTVDEASEELVPIGVLGMAAAAGDAEAVWALRGVLLTYPDLRGLVGWDPPPLKHVDSLPEPERLKRVATWCKSVWRRWPRVDRSTRPK